MWTNERNGCVGTFASRNYRLLAGRAIPPRDAIADWLTLRIREIERIVGKVPTIAVLHGVAFLDDTTLARDPRLRYVPAWFRAGWNPAPARLTGMAWPKP